MGRVANAGILGLALVCAGCAVGPNFQRPSAEVPSAWRGDAAARERASLADLPWWDLFQDPKLKALLEIALEENRDLRVAAERIVEARARLGVAQADFFPQVSGGVDGGVVEQSREGFPAIPKPADNDSALYGLGLDVSWELDVFGRIRRSSEAARARLVATEEGRRAVTLALIASVARSYIELRDLDLRLEIARRTLESRDRSRQLVQLRFTGGLTSEMDPHRAEAEYRRVEVTVLGFERQVAQKENELSVLLGRNPSEVIRGRSLPDLPVVMDVPAGLPSDLLERRPDVRAAEETLHAATADVGAARALLYPRIALTGDYGLASSEMDALFTGSAQAWSIASGLVQPIFQGGRLRRGVQVAESRMRQSLHEYENSILQAFRDVEDALVAYRKTGEQRLSQKSRVDAERKVVALSGIRYQGGVADYLEVLDAQRSLFSAELDEVQTISAQLVSLVQLYKALGGGWPSQPATVVPAASDPAPPAGTEATPVASPVE